MNILITGGLGYVGGRLTEYFSKQGPHKVYALSRTKKLKNPSQNIEVLTNADVLEGNKLAEVFIDVLIHLAAMNEHECVQHPLKAIDVNIKGTLRWLKWAQENKVKRFLFFSTAHVYGKPLAGKLNENALTAPRHPYAITHRCAEDYVLSALSEFEMETLVVRLSNSFGYPAYPTADRWTLFINDICRSIVKDRSFEIYSNRMQQRDFISLTNVCTAIEKLILYEIPERDNRIFNLSTGESRSLYEVGSRIKIIAEELFQDKIKFLYDISKDLPADSLHLSNDKLRKTGWSPAPKDDYEILKTLKFFVRNRI